MSDRSQRDRGPRTRTAAIHRLGLRTGLALALLGHIASLGAASAPASAGPHASDSAGLARTSPVLPRGSIDGRTVRIDRIDSVGAAAAAAHRIATRWRQDEDPVLVVRSGPWWIVSRLIPGGYQTAQLRDIAGGRSEGFLTDWTSAVSADPPPLPPWWPTGARRVRSVASDDGARRAVTHVGQIGLAPTAARGLMAARLSGLGWAVATPGATPAPASAAASTVGVQAMPPPVPLQATRGTASVVVSLQARASGAAFVAHESEVSP